MIVDVHSHVFRDPESFPGGGFRDGVARAHGGPVDLSVRYDAYRASAPDDTVTVAFGGKARLSGLWVDDAEVASYVRTDPARLVGFLAVDPTQAGWEADLRYGHEELGLRGVKVMPMYAGFRPDDPAYDPLWSYAQRKGLPVLSHTGTTFVSAAPLEYALPRYFDGVAARFPELRLVLAHLGHPYEGECIAVIRKHPHVYADVSALHYRPWQLYHALMLVQEYGVWNKLLFGSDYPFTTVTASVAGLRRLAEVRPHAGLPGLDHDQIEALLQRESLRLLGLEP